MKNMLNSARKNKKGFTLIEIIIVLVIIAILAAIAIPSMMGFVEQAKNSQYIAEARTAYVACQAVVTQKYAVKPDSTTLAADAVANFKNYLGATEKTEISVVAADITLSADKITKIVVKVTKGSTVYNVTLDIANDSATVVKS